MNSSSGRGGVGEDPDQDLRDTYGTPLPDAMPTAAIIPKVTEFLPWHHPVKQLVRDRQWVALTKRLIEAQSPRLPVLRYFTLPGKDLLDVRLLASACKELGVAIEYFGFDSAPTSIAPSVAPWFEAESTLRQAGRITSEAIILSDRLEDIAQANSHAAAQLGQRETFHVVNIDACDHLAYCPPLRAHSTFEALHTLLVHQLRARTPWLLFLTTRAEPHLLGNPGIALQAAITENLKVAEAQFGPALADTLEGDFSKLTSEMNAAWVTPGVQFLKIYSIALGKHLLQFFHAQPNLPAHVELASAYAYRIHGDAPDMLAIAFRIKPLPPRAVKPSAGGAIAIPDLEPANAVRVARRAKSIVDLDEALDRSADDRAAAIAGTITLLEAANYEITAWKRWIAQHPKRPINCD